MVKEIERTGIPVVHVCTVVPISMTVGANRIIPAVAIPHPFGDPKLEAKDEKMLRRRLVEKAMNSLKMDIETQTVIE
ncbi:glycine reductase [Tindallia californiensis]|nr:glycine reductase [Tindallia californiensis]